MAKRRKESDTIKQLTDFNWDLQLNARRGHIWRQLKPYKEDLMATASNFAPFDYGGLIELIYSALDYMENYHRMSNLTMNNLRNMEEIRRAKVMAAIVRTNSSEFDNETNDFKEYKVNAHNVGRFLPHYSEEDVKENPQAQRDLRTAKAANILFTMLKYNYRNWRD